MGAIATMLGAWEFNRMLTRATHDAIAESGDPRAVLGWRPAPGRAPIGWQLMHIAVTEELVATEYVLGTPPQFPELIRRFRGTSPPDDEIPSIELIRDVLSASRQHLLETISRFSDADLPKIVFAERGWSLETTLQAVAWHEPHHQGQAHAALNLWRAAHQS